MSSELLENLSLLNEAVKKLQINEIRDTRDYQDIRARARSYP